MGEVVYPVTTFNIDAAQLTILSARLSRLRGTLEKIVSFLGNVTILKIGLA